MIISQLRKHRILLLAAILVMLASYGFFAQDDAQVMLPGVMSVEEAERFVARFDEVFNIPDLDILDEIFSQDYVGHLPFAPVIDLQGLKAYIDTFRVGVPDMIQETHAFIIGEQDLVVRVTYTGTHTGPLFGVPATGNPIIMEGIGILRFNEEGLVVENWAVLDMGGVLAQIGVFPPEQ
jgi:predicted ester cyclase